MVTVIELRKMASKKKIEGRSKMNKAQLEKALGIVSSSKKLPKKTTRKYTKRRKSPEDDDFALLRKRKRSPSPKCKGGVCTLTHCKLTTKKTRKYTYHNKRPGGAMPSEMRRPSERKKLFGHY